MPVVNVHRYATSNTSGTIAVTGTLDISSGVIVELRNPPFNQTGVWTLFTFGSLVGSVSNITIDNQTTFTSGAPYLSGDGLSILITLS
jgi:hypothetical protein